ncbi:MAG: RES domain-containing protein [Acetobacteraceae bacterium]
MRPVYRAHHPRWSFEPQSGAGAARSGGRFNPVGTPALYTALRDRVAGGAAGIPVQGATGDAVCL